MKRLFSIVCVIGLICILCAMSYHAKISAKDRDMTYEEYARIKWVTPKPVCTEKIRNKDGVVIGEKSYYTVKASAEEPYRLYIRVPFTDNPVVQIGMEEMIEMPGGQPMEGMLYNYIDCTKPFWYEEGGIRIFPIKVHMWGDELFIPYTKIRYIRVLR